MGGAVEFVYRDGQRLTPWMNYQIDRLDAEFFRVWGCHIHVRSGIRTYEEQVAIFTERYRIASQVNGRHVYDTRVWNGVRWYRISPLGTVAVPSTSNHEIQGTTAAADLYDDGPGAGVATKGSARANWLRYWCTLFDMVAEGYNFNEAWHYAMLHIFQTPPTPAPTPKPVELPDEEDDMLAIHVNDSGTAHTVTLGIGTLSHMIDSDDPDKVKNQIRSRDDWTECTPAEFDVLLARFGVARDAYKFINTSNGINVGPGKGGQLVVLNAETGHWWTGQTWNRATAEANRTIADIKELLDPSEKEV
ncbi:MAG: hypothetical protein K0S70_108 [Microbacterium sp.]|jgi:hypothetical protein|nr:hypothetical protein [Microbacterium sp.]